MKVLRYVIQILLDALFFISLISAEVFLFLAVGYTQTHDIVTLFNQFSSTINMLLNVAALVVLMNLIFYFSIIPSVLHTTVGGVIAGVYFGPKERLTVGNLILKNIVGTFWDFLLFPYTLVCPFIKKPTISQRLSGVIKEVPSYKFNFKAFPIVLIFIMIALFNLYWGNLIYKDPDFVKKFIDYKSAMFKMVDVGDYTQLSNLLPDYELKYGKDSTYWYFACLASEVNPDEEDSLKNFIDLCGKALEDNSNKDFQIKILLKEASTYMDLSDTTKAEKIYKKLWEDYNYRGIEIIQYLIILVKDNSKDAYKKLQEMQKAINEDDSIGDVAKQNALLTIAELYYDLKKYKDAINLYRDILLMIEKDPDSKETQAMLNFKLGECYYYQKDYKQAKTYFNKAKELGISEEYVAQIESYLIDMTIRDRIVN